MTRHRVPVAVVVMALTLASTLNPVLLSAQSPDPAEDVQSDPALDADRNRVLDQLDATIEGAADDAAFKAIVHMVGGASGETVQQLRDDVGDFTLLAAWYDMSAFAASLTTAQIHDLAQRSDVKHLAWGGNKAHLNIDTARARTGVNVALNPDILNVTGDLDGNPYNFTSSDVVVCVIDTGVDAKHPAFAADNTTNNYTRRYDQNPRNDFWKDFAGLNATPDDVRGHGSGMAGIIVGHDRNLTTNSSNPASGPFVGVAPGAALYAVRGAIVALEEPDAVTLIDSVRWCDANYDDPTTLFVVEHLGPDFVDVISGSWGFDTDTECRNLQPDLKTAVDHAWDNGIIPMFAAGNLGPTVCSIESPAVLDKAIAVGMVSDPLNPSCSVEGAPDPLYVLGGGWYLNPHSARGSSTLAVPVLKPDVLAPGICINEAVADTPTNIPPSPPYAEGAGGTSPATAFAAGVVALMLGIMGMKSRANDPDGLTPTQVKDILRDTAFAASWGPAGKDAEFGWGVINATAAVTKACTTVFTDATNRTNICKTNATGSPVSPNVAPAQPTHASRPDEDMGAGASVDKWKLTITDTSWPISITLIIPDWPANNFDLKLEDPVGEIIAQSTNTTRQDTITPVIPTGTGVDYVIQVVNPAGGGTGDYWLDVSAGGTLEAAPFQDQ